MGTECRKSPSGDHVLRCVAHVAAAAIFFALASCGDDGSEVRPALPDAGIPADAASSPDAASHFPGYCGDPADDPCAQRTCFSVCGLAVAVEPPPRHEGFGAASRPRRRADFRRSGGNLVAVDPFELSVRSPDGADLLGRLDLPGYQRLEVVGASAFVQGPEGGILVVDVGTAEAPEPVAWWAGHNQFQFGFQLLYIVGVSGSRLALSTPNGVSLVDVSDPASPFEALCLPYPPETAFVSSVSADGDFVAVAYATEESSYEDTGFVAVYQPTLSMEPVLDFTTYVELSLLVYAGRLVYYDIEAGEFARVDLVPKPGPGSGVAGQPGLTSVFGGFLVSDGKEATRAVDLEAATGLPAYAGSSLWSDACVIELEPDAGGASWWISPWVVPDARYAADTVPAHVCPPNSRPTDGASSGALAPDGSALALIGFEGLVILRLDTGEATVAAKGSSSGKFVPPPHSFVFWFADWIIVAAGTAGDKVWSWLDVYDAADPTLAPGRVQSGGTFLDLAAFDGRLWIASASCDGGEPYGEGGPCAGARRLWTIDAADPFALPLDIPLSEDAQPDTLDVVGDRLYVTDAGGSVLILDASGAVEETVALPEPPERWHRAASQLGLFYRDRSGRMWWLPPGAASPLPHEATCSEIYPLAADSDTLYACARRPGGPALASYMELLALRPTAGADTFSLEVVARHPRCASRLLIGPPRILLNGTVTRFE